MLGSTSWRGLVQYVDDNPIAVWFVGPLFAALIGLVFKILETFYEYGDNIIAGNKVQVWGMSSSSCYRGLVSSLYLLKERFMCFLLLRPRRKYSLRREEDLFA
ncbi:hypothetical protein RchiOBHm_Chr1g0313101 [Rosa chinensis]|uniref:Uncharacterized protein n=1 Tax=Rosa chinensis TaxID=74649 RepID=A0A2P6S6T1_ROSCH|nr:hypothetical protein RchiOBHm_Chr1g0313101 [Rosa chinensis]